MRVRPLRPSDIPILKAIADSSGYPYPDFEDHQIEAVVVIVTDDNVPIMAGLARCIPEIYLIADKNNSPAVKMAALRLLHTAMSAVLRELGYTQGNASVPPEIAAKFGKRLERTFGWAKSKWPNWFINL